MRPKIRRIPQFVYSKEKSEWIEYKSPKKEEEEGEEDQKPINYRIAQLNVLFDKRYGKVYKPNICFAEERFRKQLEIYKELDANLINNNEVTTGYLQIIKSDDWIRENFFMSTITGYGKIMGNLLMSRIPFDSLYAIKLPSRKIESHVGVIRNTVFCCSHLHAYMNGGPKRRIQLNQLYRVFDIHRSFKDKNILIFGDLNFHSEKENENIREDYMDIYRTLNPSKKGYTFCARSNLMIKHMWPFGGYVIGIDSSGIQMRLDRWLLKLQKDEKNKIKFGKMKIIANELVYKNNKTEEEEDGEQEEEDGEQEEEEKEEKELDPRPSSFFGDFFSMVVDYVFEKNIWRKKEDFLFPSDHFGLFLEMTII